MRYVTKRIALLTAALSIVALPVLADDLSGGKWAEPAQQPEGKDECLIVAMSTCDRVGTIQGRIDTILNEIKKGTAVYTEDELRILQNKLEDANREMNEAYVGGGA
jgi:hypothetical protein